MRDTPTGETDADNPRCGGKMRGVNVHGGTEGPCHEQARSPVTVSLSLVCLTAAFQLRETFLMGFERWVIFLQSSCT